MNNAEFAKVVGYIKQENIFFWSKIVSLQFSFIRQKTQHTSLRDHSLSVQCWQTKLGVVIQYPTQHHMD